MATPYTGQKIKWPSENKAAAGNRGTDFVPYISNLANLFRKVPRPMAPKLVDPINGTKISLADARRQVTDTTRAADLATQDLDAQTGAAIRVGNMANKLRSLSDLNSREAQINAQMDNQTKMINANIDAQNTSATNAYHDDIVNAQIAQQRAQSENLSNAADKYIAQQTVRDQNNLEREKAIILSKQYEPGVYNRFLKNLQTGGIDVSQFGTITPDDAFAKYKGVNIPAKTPELNLNTNMSTSNMKALRRYMTQRKTYAAGGTMHVFSGDPKPGEIPVGATVNYNSRRLQTSSIDRDALLSDRIGEIIGQGYDPFSGVGRNILTDINKNFYGSQFATDLGTRIKLLQQDNTFGKLSKAERIARLYGTAHGTSEFDNFLQRTKMLGGSPSSYIQGNPTLRDIRATGGEIHIKPENRGKFTAAADSAGMGVQEYAAHVLADPDASPTLRKRANFARNAAKWNHAYGGKMTKPFC